MDKERNEDLNPRSDDIEEKVRRMLDLSVSDADDTPEAAPVVKPKKASKVEDTTGVDQDDVPEILPSAPVLPSDPKAGVSQAPIKPPSAKGSKRVIIPISHDTAPELKPVEAETAPDIKQITIADNSETTDDIAEKLNEAIAGLEPVKEVKSKKQKAKKAEPMPVEPAAERTESEDGADVLETVNEAAKDEAVESLSADGTDKADEETVDESLSASDETDNDEAVLTEPEVIADPQTDKVVEDIIAAESDEILEIEDAVRDTDEPLKPQKKQRRRLGALVKGLWAKRGFRWALLVLVLAGLLTAGAVPASRYFILNTAGVRANSTLTVLDDSTQQPLKNVQVAIGSAHAVTDSSGNVNLTHVKLGSAVLTVDKRAFAPVSKKIVIGWGSNPLNNINLTPTGTQYSFTVTDFLSGKPIKQVEATSDEASALSDDKGIIKLTIDKPADDKLIVSFKGGDYRSEELTLDPNDKTDHGLKLVPARKQLFISKRSGKFDMYSVYIDGKDEKLVLAGSGTEREEDLVIVPHPTAGVAAYVSTRGNQHNSDNFLLSNLILINTENNETTNIAASERIQIIDWSGDRLVYVQIAAGASANNPKRYRLMSYDYKEESSKELASSNFFNDVVAADGAIYYAPSSAYQTGKTSFYKINADGTGSQTVFDSEVWNIIRTSYDHLALSVQQQWYDYHLGDKAPTKLNSAPANQVPRVYINSPDGKHSVWVDSRDGKGVLLAYDTAAKSDATLLAQSGITYPTYWLTNSTLVFRVKTPQETADYAISIDGGKAVKIKDVTNTGGIDRWYYY